MPRGCVQNTDRPRTYYQFYKRSVASQTPQKRRQIAAFGDKTPRSRKVGGAYVDLTVEDVRRPAARVPRERPSARLLPHGTVERREGRGAGCRPRVVHAIPTHGSQPRLPLIGSHECFFVNNRPWIG